MKKAEIVIIIVALVSVTIATPTVVVAQPTIPESYWGNATLDDVSPPIDTPITVEVYETGEVVGNTTVADANGLYTLDVYIGSDDNPDDGYALNGDNLTWKIDGINCSVPAPGTDTAEEGGNNSNFNISAYHCGLELSAHPTQRSVKEGEDANYTITIKNTGYTVDTFNLTVINTSGTPDRASLSINATSLSADESGDVILTINGSAGTYVTTVTATSRNDTSKTASVTVITDVSAEDLYGVSMSSNVTSKSVEKNENAAYNLTIENTGNQQDTFNLTLFKESDINASLSDEFVTLNSGESAYVILTVNGSTVRDYSTQVTADSQNSAKSDTVTLGTTILSAISLSVAPQSLAITTGGNATYTLTLNNTGTTQHTYNLSALPPANADITLSETEVTLNASESISIELNVSSGTAGTYGVSVEVNTTSAGGVLEEASILTTTIVNPAAVYGVSLSVSPTSRSVGAGVNATYTLTVQNAGNQPDTFNLTLINPRADNATLSKYSTTELSAGASETILLNVSDSEGGSYEVKVIAESQHDPGKQDSVTTTTNVLSYGVVITADSTSKTAYAGNLTTYTLTIENTGNTADTFDLTLTNKTGLNIATISTDSVSLASGATAEVTLTLNASDGTYWAEVTATSRGNTSKTDSVKVTTTFQSVPKYGVSMSISSASKRVEKNEDAVYTVSVMNTGNREDTYTLTTTIGAIGTTSLTIPAGDTKSTTLTVNGTEIKTYTSIVSATSSEGPSVTKSVSTTVIPSVRIKATPASRTLYLGNESTFTITIKNTGTMSHTYNLSVTNTSDTAELSASSVSLSKGSSADITLTMNDTEAGVHTVLVTAAARDDPTNKKASVLVTTSYQTVPVYGVDLEADDTTRITESDKYALYVLTVTNLGNQNDTFNLTLINPRADFATLTKTITSNLSAGASETILLNVSDSEGGNYEVKVIAESQNDPGKQDSITTTTNVLSYGVVITADSTSKTTYVGNLTTYTLTVENTGNTADTFDLTLTNHTGLNIATISTDTVSLASGTTAEVTLTLNASANEYWANVTATSRGNSNKNDSVNVTTTFKIAPEYGVGLSISPASKEVEKNEDAVYTVSVMNTGNREDTYTLTTTIGALGASSLTIPAGDTASTTLTVNGTEIKTYTAVVTATSSHVPYPSKTTSVSTTVIPAVSLEATPASKTLYIGNKSTFTITIKNIGTTSHNYSLSVTANTSDTAELSASAVVLAKGDCAVVTLTMNASAEGMYTATVTAADQTETSKNASIMVSTLYLEAPVYGVDLRVDAKTKTIEPGKYALYVLTVKNLGNMQDTFNLNITLNETPAMLSEDNMNVSLSLEASGTVGDSATVRLNVTPPATVGEYDVHVKASSQTEPSASDIVKTTTKVAGTAGTNTIVNSKIDETSTITNSTIIRSTIVRSLIINSTITDSEITDCSIYNSTVNDTALKDIKLENASVNAGNITSGKITMDGITYEISEEIAITNIVVSSDEEDSSVAGSSGDTTDLTLGTHTAKFKIGNNESYVGGSLKAQESSVPTEGTIRLSLGTGEYINIDASDNIKEGMSWVMINVTYDESKLGRMREERLRLYCYNETENKWVRLVSAGNPSWCYGAGVNTEENYVWANVSHFSDFGNGGGGEVPEQEVGGVAVDVLPKIQKVNATETCNNFTIRVTNGQNYEDTIDLKLTLSGIPVANQSDLSWFNWTAGSVVVSSKASKNITLMADTSEAIPGETNWMYYFSIIAEGTSGFARDYGAVNNVTGEV